MWWGKEKQEPKKVSYLSTDVLVPTGVLCSAFLAGFYVYRQYLRRVPNSRKLPDAFIKKRTLLGSVTSVGDADNFHFFHTPGGRLLGWGWLRKIPKSNREAKGETLHIRLCGVDAPEGSHFGKPSQKYYGEALMWLKGFVLGRRVRILPLARDQYGRTVAEAKVWTWSGRKNVSMEMLRNGWAVVYEAKTGAEFNGKESEYRALEMTAKKKKVGIFRHGTSKLETPAEYKRKYNH
jgi:micrococcal nuclease